MATLTLFVKGGAQLTDAIKNDKGHGSLMTVINHLEACRSGNTKGTVYGGSSATDPAFATNTATLTYASIANNDTITIAGTVLTCVTGTPTTDQFKKVTDAATTATNLAAAINAQTTLKTFLSAAAVGGVVTITCYYPGKIGNTLTLATSNAPGFALGAATFSGGAGGIEAASTSYTIG